MIIEIGSKDVRDPIVVIWRQNVNYYYYSVMGFLVIADLILLERVGGEKSESLSRQHAQGRASPTNHFHGFGSKAKTNQLVRWLQFFIILINSNAIFFSKFGQAQNFNFFLN